MSEPAKPGSPVQTAPAEPTLPVAAVAGRLGIAPATLRTWDRRYGVGPTEHTIGRHRRYAPSDIARLELMQRALLKGAAPAEAAEYALRATADAESRGGGVDLSADQDAHFGPYPDRLAAVRRAVLAMDDDAIQRVIAEAIAADGVVVTWDQIVRPVLDAVAGRWAHSGEEVEYLVREGVLAAMIRAAPLVAIPRNPRPVLLCCAPGERHSLSLYALRAALARRDIGTRMFGAELPSAALGAAVRRTAPAAVALWAQLPAFADAAVLAQIPRTSQRVHLFACGPGWARTRLPARVDYLDSLAFAVDRIEAFVLGATDSAR